MLTTNDFKAKQILIVVPKEGQKLAFRNDNVVVFDHDEKIIHQSTCYRLFAIFIIGHMTITTALMQKARKFGFAIVTMSTNFRLYQVISVTGEGNTLLRQKQYQYNELEAAKKVVCNKMSNQKQQLLYVRDKDENLKESVIKIDDLMEKVLYAKSIREIMGYEGNASKFYFSVYFDNVEWKGRKPRVKTDMINAVLDIGYTMLFSYVDAILAVYGFDRYVGILHRQFYMRKSLVCDMVEPFRVIIDKQVKKGINLHQIKKEDFTIKDEKWILKYEKAADYAQLMMKAINDNKEDIYNYIRKVYIAFMKKDIGNDFPIWEY